MRVCHLLLLSLTVPMSGCYLTMLFWAPLTGPSGRVNVKRCAILHAAADSAVVAARYSDSSMQVFTVWRSEHGTPEFARRADDSCPSSNSWGDKRGFVLHGANYELRVENGDLVLHGPKLAERLLITCSIARHGPLDYVWRITLTPLVVVIDIVTTPFQLYAWGWAPL